ncbi:MAG: hypothetical protein MJ197_07670 [Bacteroidales bacterium]|nr:hypothetical protein [Bacteroidales bacterium]
MADTTARDKLLTEMFLQYWKYPVKPTFQDEDQHDIADDSVEGLTLAMYESVKDEALMVYPWRSAQKYVFLNNPQENDTGDGKYKYKFTLPTDFLTANGFWLDKERNQPFQNGVDIIGNIAKTNKSAFMLQYTANMSGAEANLDPWVIDWIKLYLAATLADIGGVDPNTKNFLIQKMQFDEPTLKNKDFEMSHHDETIGNEDQFLHDWY